MNFGTTLRTTRKRRGVTQRELAELVGVDHTYLSKVENNRMPPPSVRTIRRIAHALSVDADELLTAAGRPPCRCVALKEQVQQLADAVVLLSRGLQAGNVHLHQDGFGGSCRCGDCRRWHEALALAQQVRAAR